MKIKEVLFFIGVFVVSVQAANFYTLVDIQNDEVALETPEVVPLTLDVTFEATEKQGITANEIKKIKLDSNYETSFEIGTVKPDIENFDQKITDDQKNLFMNVKLELLELQNRAILDQLQGLEEKNKDLQDELDAKTKLQAERDAEAKLQEELAAKANLKKLLDARRQRYQATKQKPARVQLEQSSQNSDKELGFWDWLCFVTKKLARGVLNFFGIHV